MSGEDCGSSSYAVVDPSVGYAVVTEVADSVGVCGARFHFRGLGGSGRSR